MIKITTIVHYYNKQKTTHSRLKGGFSFCPIFNLNLKLIHTKKRAKV